MEDQISHVPSGVGIVYWHHSDLPEPNEAANEQAPVTEGTITEDEGAEGEADKNAA
jgi:hypothetical protein